MCLVYDPACWPERKSLALSNLDRLCTVLAPVLLLDSPQEPAKDRTASLRPIALRRPSQRLNHQNNKRKLRTSGIVQCSLSAYSSSRKRKWSILKRAYLRSSLGSLIYLCAFSLLTVTHLDTWLASSCTHVTIWSILDLSVPSYSSGYSTKLLTQEATQRVAALERDLFCVASTGAFMHTFPVVSPAAIILYFTYFTVHAQVRCSLSSTSG